MKFNKWTVGLAAVGVVSLVSAVKAEEKANVVQTALSSTTLSGYVDTSAQWNFGTGNANMPPYKFGGTGKADGFNLNVVQVRIENPLDYERDWSAGYKVDLWYGPDANTLGTQSTHIGSDFAIRQAYVSLHMSIGNGLDWKVGVFDSIIGYESVESGSNPNYTRSYGHSLEPQTHTGILGTYRFSDMFSASAGIANTVSSAINSRATQGASYTGGNSYAESYKAYMGSLQMTAPDSWGTLARSTFYGGVVNGYNNTALGTPFGLPTMNSYVGATLATPVKNLRVGIAWDRLDVNTQTSAPGANVVRGDAWSLAGYVSFQATEKLSLHGRFEYVTGNVESPAAASTLSPFVNNGIWATTATVQYDLWKNVLTRLEFRWDTADHGNLFGGTTGAATAENAFMLAANVIYKF